MCIHVWHVAIGSYRRCFEWCHYANLGTFRQRLFSKRGMLPSADQLTSDHSHMTILPERQTKIFHWHVNLLPSKGDYTVS